MLTGGAPSAIAGGWRYSVTRNLDGSGANNWVAGDAVVSLGRDAGEGYIDLTSTSTIHSHAGPTMATYARTGSGSWNSVVPTTVQGNLDGFVDYSATEFGFAFGNDLTLTPTTGLKGGTLDRTNGVRLFNVDAAFYASGTKVLGINPTDGIRILGDTSGTINYAGIRSYRFWDGTVDYGGIYGASVSTGATADKYVALRTETNNAAADANLLVQAFNNASGGLGSILIQANDAEIALNHVNASSSSISLTATTVTANGSTIWTAGNDGASSGLNADLLDGYQSTDFAVVASANTFLARQTIRGGSGNVYSYLNPTGTAETVELRFANNDVSKGRLLYAGANSSPNKYFGFISAAEYLAMASDVTWFRDGAFSASFAYLSSAGLAIGLGSAATDALDINGTGIRLRSSRTPSSAGATGNQGTICWDTNYLYVCTATNTWKRAALATW